MVKYKGVYKRSLKGLKIVILTGMIALFLSSCLYVDFRESDNLKNINAKNTVEYPIPQTAMHKHIVDFFAEDNGKEKKCVVFGLDGVRSDSIAELDVNELIEREELNFYFSFTGGIDKEQKTLSSPGWATLFTGEWQDVHQIVSNATPAKNPAAESFLKKVHEMGKGYKVASLVNWHTINRALLSDEGELYDYKKAQEKDKNGFKNEFKDGYLKYYGVEDWKVKDRELTDKAIELFTDGGEEADLVFIAWDLPDGAGHSHGFSPLVQEYLDSIQVCLDDADEILDTIKARDNYSKEDWLIIYCTDHGGFGFGHGGQTDGERMIWLMSNKELSKK